MKCSCLSLFLAVGLVFGQDVDAAGQSGPEEEAGRCQHLFDSEAGPNGGSKMGWCQGDCDQDSDCQPGLKCKQRDSGEAVPGCSGGKSYPDWDYCYDPRCEDAEDPPLDSSFGRYGSENMPICSGDCDQDSDCADGLQCFQRDGVQAVPGCSGRGVPNFDYCYNSSTATPPPGGSPCLCVFDIDRTLTGQQGAGSRCPLNKEIPDVWDSAYGGGRLSLSAAAQALDQTFCNSCFLGVVSAGDASGSRSSLRRFLVSDVLRSKPFDALRETNSGATRWCSHWRVDCPLVLRSPNRRKQDAVEGIVAWYGQQDISIPANEVYFFGDRTENIRPMSRKGFNSKEISCGERDFGLYRDGMVGLCGATVEEIVDTPGISMCRDRRRLLV